MRSFRFLLLILTVAMLAGCTAGDIYVPPTLTPLPGEGAVGPSARGNPVAVIETNRGTIRCELRPDAAPKTVANFEKLADSGWYDGHLFFRVEPGYVVQGGSPNDTASGSIGYDVDAEIGLSHEAGALAMARTPDSVNPERKSDGSQFYIALSALPQLDGAYTVFGYCGQSLDVILKIQVGDRMTQVRVEK